MIKGSHTLLSSVNGSTPPESTPLFILFCHNSGQRFIWICSWRHRTRVVVLKNVSVRYSRSFLGAVFMDFRILDVTLVLPTGSKDVMLLMGFLVSSFTNDPDTYERVMV